MKIDKISIGILILILCFLITKRNTIFKKISNSLPSDTVEEFTEDSGLHLGEFCDVDITENGKKADCRKVFEYFRDKKVFNNIKKVGSYEYVSIPREDFNNNLNYTNENNNYQEFNNTNENNNSTENTRNSYIQNILKDLISDKNNIFSTDGEYKMEFKLPVGLLEENMNFKIMLKYIFDNDNINDANIVPKRFIEGLKVEDQIDFFCDNTDISDYKYIIIDLDSDYISEEYLKVYNHITGETMEVLYRHYKFDWRKYRYDECTNLLVKNIHGVVLNYTDDLGFSDLIKIKIIDETKNPEFYKKIREQIKNFRIHPEFNKFYLNESCNVCALGSDLNEYKINIKSHNGNIINNLYPYCPLLNNSCDIEITKLQDEEYNINITSKNFEPKDIKLNDLKLMDLELKNNETETLKYIEKYIKKDCSEKLNPFKPIIEGFSEENIDSTREQEIIVNLNQEDESDSLAPGPSMDSLAPGPSMDDSLAPGPSIDNSLAPGPSMDDSLAPGPSMDSLAPGPSMDNSFAPGPSMDNLFEQINNSVEEEPSMNNSINSENNSLESVNNLEELEKSIDDSLAPGPSHTMLNSEGEKHHTGYENIISNSIAGINKELLSIINLITQGYVNFSNKQLIQNKLDKLETMIKKLETNKNNNQDTDNEIVFLKKLLLTSQMQINNALHKLANEPKNYMKTPNLPGITQFKPEGPSNIFSPLIDIRTSDANENDRFSQAYEKGFREGMKRTNGKAGHIGNVITHNYIDDNSNVVKNMNETHENKTNESLDITYSPMNRRNNNYIDGDLDMENYQDNDNNTTNNLKASGFTRNDNKGKLGIPGYSYLNPDLFDVPQERTPICHQTNNPKRGNTSLEPAGYLGSGNSNVMEFHGIGSILPKFKYEEYTQDLPDKTNQY